MLIIPQLSGTGTAEKPDFVPELGLSCQKA
jgi:hypothetical protein